MQHLLNRLWLTATPDAYGRRALALEDYERLGGLNGALDAHGAEVLAALPAEDLPAAEKVCRALVTGPDLASAVRRPCRFDELTANLDGDVERARRIVDALRAPDCNFLRPGTERVLTDATIVDISHESLIRQWDVLAGWARAETHSAANWQRLARAQERHAVGEADLLTGIEADSLAAWWDSELPNPAWAARHGGDYQAVAAFLAESRASKAAAEAARLEQARKERRHILDQQQWLQRSDIHSLFRPWSACGGYAQDQSWGSP